MQHPIVFISYSWDNDEHKQWVLNLADRLISDGIDVYLDRYELRLGRNLTHFIENSIQRSDRIIIIFTPNYRLKADGRSGGVGYEYSIINTGMYSKIVTQDKIIPVLRSGTSQNSIPDFMQQFIHLDLSNDLYFEKNYQELIRDIYNEPEIKKPAIGKKPEFTAKGNSHHTPVYHEHTKPSNEGIMNKTSENPNGVFSGDLALPKRDSSQQILRLQAELEELQKVKRDAVSRQQFEQVAALRGQEKTIEELLGYVVEKKSARHSDRNFSIDLRDVIANSRKEALYLGNDFIGSEHLLLGLLSLDKGLAIQILRGMHGDLPSLKKSIENMVKYRGGKHLDPNASLPLTKEAERIIRITNSIAEETNSFVVYPEHLVLALLKDKNSTVCSILKEFNIEERTFIQQVIKAQH